MINPITSPFPGMDEPWSKEDIENFKKALEYYDLDDERRIKMTKTYSYDGEWYNYNSKEEAIDAGALSVGDVVYVGDAELYTAAGFVSGYSILKNIGEAAYDEASEFSDMWPDFTKEDAKEIEDIVAAWVQAKFPPKFYRVVNIKELPVTEEDMAGIL